MKERELAEAITAGDIEALTLFGTPAGWELWASPPPRGKSERLESALGKVRAFKSVDNAVKLTRQLGWSQTITLDGIAAAA